mmetsp:Transcript_20401/g.41339  ORF Transcript_20401/g.41339 Transcript_20401/m.41339 type:complete len:109 (+) Transcript_20401:124-450(+)
MMLLQAVMGGGWRRNPKTIKEVRQTKVVQARGLARMPGWVCSHPPRSTTLCILYPLRQLVLCTYQTIHEGPMTTDKAISTITTFDIMYEFLPHFFWYGAKNTHTVYET